MLSERRLHSRRLSIGLALIATASSVPATLHAQALIAPPKIVELSSDRGPVQPLQQASITIHLKLHNEDAYNKAIEQLYTPGSATYHHWMTKSDLAKYAPTASEVAAVKNELHSYGLSVVSSSADNFSVRARGPVTSLESAFHTQFHNYEQNSKTFYANTTPAQLTGAAAPFVKSVSGLSSFPLKPYVKYQVNPRTGKQLTRIPISKTTGNVFDKYFTNQCFEPAGPLTLTTAGSSLPVGQYFGNYYDNVPRICGWNPDLVQKHYGLPAAYAQGLDGTGETIVIVDGPSDPSVADDLATFSKLAGLPAPTASNFQVIYPDGKPTDFTLQNITNWDTEAALDIEWSHAIAPKAKIVLLITPTEDWTEFEFAIQYALDNKLGNVISNSYGYPEAAWGAYTLSGFDQVLKTAAAQGVAVNFSSGDGGDEGTGAPNVGGASYPASSSYVTSIGGTSIGLPDGGGHIEVGWGNNAAILSFATDFVLDPPILLGSLGGSGGGESVFIAKPAWQSSLPGTFRQQPDISAVADPYTGAIIVSGGELGVIGGTSLSSPIFSAIWALADQKAGWSLGQAAPLLPTLPKGAIHDIVPYGSPTNVAGIVFNSAGSTYYSSDTLLAPLGTTKTYFSGLWNVGEGEFVDISFGTDTSLTVTKGWDNVTGWGVPVGLTFINAAAAAK